MSYVSPLKLKPSIPDRELNPLSPMDWILLLKWLLYNPFALAEYSNALQLRTSPFARWRLFTFVFFLCAGVLAIFGLFMPVASESFEIASYNTGDLAIGLILGAFVAVFALVIIGELYRLPVAASLFAFSFGIILPILHFSQLGLLQNQLNSFDSSVLFANLRWFCLVFGFSIGYLLNNLVLSLRLEQENNTVENWIRWLVVLGLILGAVLFNGRYLAGNFLMGAVNLFLVTISAILGYIRPLNLIYGLFVDNANVHSSSNEVETARVAVYVPGIKQSMASWLSKDWVTGVKNLSEFWQYSNLRNAVASALYQDLKRVQKAKAARDPDYQKEDVPKRVAGLLSSSNWDLDELAARMYDRPWQFWNQLALQASYFANAFKKSTFEYQLPTITGAKPPPVSVWRPFFPIEDDIDRTLAGLLYLHHLDPANALDMFKALPSSSALGKEMTSLVSMLKDMQSKRFSPELFTKIKFQSKPEKPIRPNSWTAIGEFKDLLDNAWLYVRTKDEDMRLELRHKTLEHWQKLVKNEALFPEKATISQIAQAWKPELDKWIYSDKYYDPGAIKSPYKVNVALEQKHGLFVGHKNDIETLTDAISAGRPILLYGNARIGKTSLLNAIVSAAKPMLLSWLDLRGLNLPNMSVGQQAFKMLGQSLKNQITTKTTGDLTDYNFFHDFLDEISRTFSGTDKRIVIVLDNFEEALRNQSNENDLGWLVRFLGSMHFHAKNISLIFSGRLTADEFEQLCQGAPLNELVEMKVSFLDEATTKVLLNKPIYQPDNSLLARFDDDACKNIFALTNGHPFLIQQIAQAVLARYNSRLKNKEEVNPIFQVSDVEAIHADPNFWKTLEDFFEDLEGQAMRYSAVSEWILNVLASRNVPVTADEIAAQINRASQTTDQPLTLDEEQITDALNRLKEMDIVKSGAENNAWELAIPLHKEFLQSALAFG